MSQGDCSHFSRQTPNSHGRAVDGDFSLHSLNLSPARVMELPRVYAGHKIQIFSNSPQVKFCKYLRSHLGVCQ